MLGKLTAMQDRFQKMLDEFTTIQDIKYSFLKMLEKVTGIQDRLSPKMFEKLTAMQDKAVSEMLEI